MLNPERRLKKDTRNKDASKKYFGSMRALQLNNLFIYLIYR